MPRVISGLEEGSRTDEGGGIERARGASHPASLPNQTMTEHRKWLAAVGDAILLASVRLYLYNRRQGIPYAAHARLIGRMVCNERLIELAIRERLTAHDGEKLSDSFEVETAERFLFYGFKSASEWIEQVYDRHFDLAGEVRRIMEPAPLDKIERQVRGALKTSLRNGTLDDVQHTTRVILRVLRDAGSI